MLDLSTVRGLHPIYIWINKPSFIKEILEEKTTLNFQNELAVRRIPLYILNYKMDLKECLENGVISTPQGIPVF